MYLMQRCKSKSSLFHNEQGKSVFYGWVYFTLLTGRGKPVPVLRQKGWSGSVFFGTKYHQFISGWGEFLNGKLLACPNYHFIGDVSENKVMPNRMIHGNKNTVSFGGLHVRFFRIRISFLKPSLQLR